METIYYVWRHIWRPNSGYWVNKTIHVVRALFRWCKTIKILTSSSAKWSNNLFTKFYFCFLESLCFVCSFACFAFLSFLYFNTFFVVLFIDVTNLLHISSFCQDSSCNINDVNVSLIFFSVLWILCALLENLCQFKLCSKMKSFLFFVLFLNREVFYQNTLEKKSIKTVGG